MFNVFNDVVTAVAGEVVGTVYKGKKNEDAWLTGAIKKAIRGMQSI